VEKPPGLYKVAAKIACRKGRDKPAKYDYEYKRNGVCNILMATEPLTGKRYVITKTKKIGLCI